MSAICPRLYASVRVCFSRLYNNISGNVNCHGMSLHIYRPFPLGRVYFGGSQVIRQGTCNINMLKICLKSMARESNFITSWINKNLFMPRNLLHYLPVVLHIIRYVMYPCVQCTWPIKTVLCWPLRLVQSPRVSLGVETDTHEKIKKLVITHQKTVGHGRQAIKFLWGDKFVLFVTCLHLGGHAQHLLFWLHRNKQTSDNKSRLSCQDMYYIGQCRMYSC